MTDASDPAATSHHSTSRARPLINGLVRFVALAALSGTVITLALAGFGVRLAWRCGVVLGGALLAALRVACIATTRRARRTRCVVLSTLAPLLLVGCSSAAPDPIRLGRAPAERTGKIDLSLPVHPSGFFEFDSWPDACSLLTDADVRAVFPQAGEIHRTREEKQLTVVGNLLSNVVPDPPVHVTVQSASCSIGLRLPGSRWDEKSPEYSGYRLSVDVDAAGRKSVVRNGFNNGLIDDDPEARVAGADCTFARDRTRFSCVKGHLAFSVGIEGVSPNQGEMDGELSIRYQVGTKVTAFKGREPKVLRAQSRFEQDHIGTELVKAVAAKI